MCVYREPKERKKLRPKMTADAYRDALEMRREGCDFETINMGLGVKNNIMRNFLARWTPERDEYYDKLVSIRSYREKHGLSIAEICAEIGMSTGSYGAIESGRLFAGENFEKVMRYADRINGEHVDITQELGYDPDDHALMDLAVAAVRLACADVTELNRRIKKLNADLKKRKYVSHSDREAIDHLVAERDRILDWISSTHIMPPTIDGEDLAKALRNSTIRLKNEIVGKGSSSWQSKNM